MDYGVYSRHSACLRTISARCQIQSTPRFGTKVGAKIMIFLHNAMIFPKKCLFLHNNSFMQ